MHASAVPKSTRPTVLIVDDHPVWRHGLRSVLEPTFEVVSEACDGRDAIAQALAWKPDVVMMDIWMPGMDGIAATRQIKGALPETGVVIISRGVNDELVHQSILAGASAYVVKDAPGNAMIEAATCAAEGQAYLPPDLTKRVLNRRRGLAVGFLTPNLTSREITVLRLLAEGHRGKQIARNLGISPRTVANHVASIYNKLGMGDRVQAIRYAVKTGIANV